MLKKTKANYFKFKCYFRIGFTIVDENMKLDTTSF